MIISLLFLICAVIHVQANPFNLQDYDEVFILADYNVQYESYDAWKAELVAELESNLKLGHLEEELYEKTGVYVPRSMMPPPSSNPYSGDGMYGEEKIEEQYDSLMDDVYADLSSQYAPDIIESVKLHMTSIKDRYIHDVSHSATDSLRRVIRSGTRK